MVRAYCPTIELTGQQGYQSFRRLWFSEIICFTKGSFLVKSALVKGIGSMSAFTANLYFLIKFLSFVQSL